MNKVKNLSFGLMLLTAFLFHTTTVAQVRTRAIVSPEVHPDQTATFRITARDAKTVNLSIPDVKITKAMEKNESGVWSVTIGPLEPDIYCLCLYG